MRCGYLLIQGSNCQFGEKYKTWNQLFSLWMLVWKDRVGWKFQSSYVGFMCVSRYQIIWSQG